MTTATEPMNGRIVLSLDQIMAADDLQTEWVGIPEWAPKDALNKDAYGLYVRSLNGKERATWQTNSLLGSGKNQTVNFQNTTVELVRLSAVDATGKQIFTPAQVNDLRRKNSGILERISDAAMRVSKIGDQEMADVSGNSMGNEDSPTS